MTATLTHLNKTAFLKDVATNFPERMRSLPNRNLHSGNVNFFVHTRLNLFGGCSLEEQLKGLSKVQAGLFDCIALAGDIKFRAKRYVSALFTLNNCCKLFYHGSSSNSVDLRSFQLNAL